MIKKTISWVFYFIWLVPALIAAVWACLAILIDGPQDYAGKSAAGLYAIAALTGLFFIRSRKVGLLFYALSFAIVCFWWLQIKPRNDRDWTPDVAKLPSAEFNGDLVTIHNVRNFDYKSETDFTEHWEDRTYDLSKVKSFDVFLSYWGVPWMAHAISSWEFSDGRHLAISIETRKEIGETYSALYGFFRQFELYYVVADERDVIKLRTNFRKEDVYLYKLKESPETSKAVLIDYLKEINAMTSKPRWYNALTTNCSTAIRQQRSHVMKVAAWNWKMLANGYLDELAYEDGKIDTSLPFEETRRRSYINKLAQQANPLLDFSAEIRKPFK
jgi:hypothetical protein